MKCRPQEYGSTIVSFRNSPKRQRKSLADLKRLVETALSLDDLSKRTRSKPYPDARKIFWLLADNHGHTREKMARISGRNHSSATNGIQAACDLLKFDKDFLEMYKRVSESI